jgi:hypothetical protein
MTPLGCDGRAEAQSAALAPGRRRGGREPGPALARSVLTLPAAVESSWLKLGFGSVSASSIGVFNAVYSAWASGGSPMPFSCAATKVE